MAKKNFTREYLIEAMQTLHERLGHTPTEADTHDYPDVPGHVTYIRRFGGWREALETAGVPLDPRNTGYDRETLLEHLRAVVEQLGRAPTRADMSEVDGPCPATYASHFGTWTDALAQIGLEPRRGGTRIYETEELLDVVRDLADELGHAPTTTELLGREDLPDPTTFTRRFGTWNQALRDAGLTPRFRSSRPKYADQDQARD